MNGFELPALFFGCPALNEPMARGRESIKTVVYWKIAEGSFFVDEIFRPKRSLGKPMPLAQAFEGGRSGLSLGTSLKAK